MTFSGPGLHRAVVDRLTAPGQGKSPLGLIPGPTVGDGGPRLGPHGWVAEPPRPRGMTAMPLTTVGWDERWRLADHGHLQSGPSLPRPGRLLSGDGVSEK